MKTTIGIYDTHEDAIDAVKELHNAGFPKKLVTIIGKVKNPDPKAKEEASVDKLEKYAGTEVGLSVLAGTTLGVLTGVGVFAVPGLGFLFGAGALVGAIAGFDFGLVGGGIISALTLPNVHEKIAKKYDEEIKSGKFLVIAHGSEADMFKAKEIMSNHDKYSGLEMH